MAAERDALDEAMDRLELCARRVAEAQLANVEVRREALADARRAVRRLATAERWIEHLSSHLAGTGPLGLRHTDDYSAQMLAEGAPEFRNMRYAVEDQDGIPIGLGFTLPEALDDYCDWSEREYPVAPPTWRVAEPGGGR